MENTKIETWNLYQRLWGITAELQTVGKNLTVGVGKGTYKAVSERDIIDAVKPIEHRYRVFSYPYQRNLLESQVLESQTDYGTKNTFMMRIDTIYRFVNIDNPAEYIDIPSFAEGIDTGDKASGKAMTYADKYALMKAYKISTGDDPDKDAIPENGYSKKGATPTKGKTPREQLIAKLNEKGINVSEYATAHGLNAKTTPETFLQLLKELEG